ncbi:hypothetical protein RHMOL_Rhmol06G0213100 [Rhododendron molle]|uniref:Uncharacterized protein n=1 Tax=Rhododendron molle TaxID=49168 RepID=A0ACC0NEK4_RHOML|nr:hypothetical protein RHMOL_Rhmol06G0213100 [Rhododendron molle]
MEGTKRKQIKMEDHDVVEKRDCLVELPEPLLHHILSYLTMKDVIRTSVLAKRWRYTWLYVPCLTFPALTKTRSEEVAFINKSLLVHKGSKVLKLDITFKYHTEAGLFDSWIQFALTRKAISSTENQTQDCREKHVIDLISFDVTCLWIKAGLIKSELPGIAYILSHSPNVETLIISIDKIRGNEDTYNFRENEYWKHQEPEFVNLLCNLKDVKIYNFAKNLRLLDSKPMSTTDDFLAHLQNDMDFLTFLLKNSKALEKMTITNIKKVNFGRNSKSKKRKLLFQLTQELQAFPRASQAAQISFN